MTALRVVVVMPPVTELDPAAALGLWPTFTAALEALRATGAIEPVGCCHTANAAEIADRNSIPYYFETSDRSLAERVAGLHPSVVHIHGLGFTRLLVALRHAVGRDVPILLQHHGELPPTSRRVLIARRVTRRMVDGYMFTGSAGQAEPFRRAGVISRTAPVYEVLESASHLDAHARVPQAQPLLDGNPCVLWVGRLIPSKDPLCAVRAIADARARGSDARLHMLATDRSMEADVRALATSLGMADDVRLHTPVDHAEMAEWYRRADVYLSTSHHEGSNYSLIEALGFGCHPVVTDIPSHQAIVKDLVRMFAVGDAEGAGALIAEPSAKSREVVVDHALRTLSWQTIAAQLVEVYSRCGRA
jgi:glycosyltransferase involved in cell wall biosynthesis